MKPNAPFTLKYASRQGVDRPTDHHCSEGGRSENPVLRPLALPRTGCVGKTQNTPTLLAVNLAPAWLDVIPGFAFFLVGMHLPSEN